MGQADVMLVQFIVGASEGQRRPLGVPAGRAEFCIVFWEFCNVVPFPASDRRRCQSPDSR
jgi:hypothetical protein